MFESQEQAVCRWQKPALDIGNVCVTILWMVIVTQYQRSDGVIPFREWFDSLESPAAIKVRTAIAQMEAGNFGDHKSVGKGVFERRLHFQQGYRIYFAKDGPALVLLLAGGTKSRQQADIEQARLAWDDYKTRKRRRN